MKPIFSDPIIWAYGLYCALVTGAVNAALNTVGTFVIGDKMNLNQIAVCAMTGGLTGAFLYLKQSPAPHLTKEVTTVEAEGTPTVSVTKTTTQQ